MTDEKKDTSLTYINDENISPDTTFMTQKKRRNSNPLIENAGREKKRKNHQHVFFRAFSATAIQDAKTETADVHG
jgi:hypothetical protein